MTATLSKKDAEIKQRQWVILRYFLFNITNHNLPSSFKHIWRQL